MLRILKSEEPLLIERLNLCIYAPPGVGKTTLSFTADDPLLLDFDRGVHRAANRKDSVQVASWSDVETIAKDDLLPYKTLIADTAGRALDFLTAKIIKDNPKLGKGGGALTLQGYGELKARFSAWLKFINTMGLDVVLIAHMDEQRSGDDIVERLDVQGGSKGEIYKSVDAMGRIFIRDKKRVLDFSPRENSFGKNPANLDVLAIPDIAQDGHFLASVIAGIKQSINHLSDEQKQAQAAIETWAEAIRDFSNADEFNRNLPEIKKAPKAAQLAFNSKAKAIGLTFNKASGLYEGKPVKDVQPSEEREFEELFPAVEV